LCILEEGDCPEACEGVVKKAEDKKQDETKDEDNEKKSGKLTVSVDDYSSAVKSIPSAGVVTVNDINFSSDEEVTVYGVTFETAGMTSNKDVKSIWFEQNSRRIGSKASIQSDGTAEVNFNGDGMTVKKNETVKLKMELASWATAGGEISFKIVDIKSSAKSSKIGTDTTTTLRTTTYEVATAKFEALDTNSGTIYKLGERDSFELARFTLENDSPKKDDKDIAIKDITLKNNGSADIKALSKVKVTVNSEDVSDDYSIDGKSITINLNDTIPAGKKKTYIVYANIDYVDGQEDYYQFSLNKDSDLNVEEVKSEFSTKVVATGNFARFDVRGGKFNMASTSNVSSVDAGRSYNDVVVAEGTITATAAATIDDGTNGSIEIGGKNFEGLKNLKFEVNNSTCTLDIVATGANSIARCESQISLKNGVNKVRVLANLQNDQNSGGVTKITINAINGDSFKGQGSYDSNDENFTASNEIKGSISVANINIKDANFNIVNTTKSSEVKIVATTSNTVDLFAGELRNNQNATVNVNSIIISGSYNTGELQAKESLDIELFVNGKPVDQVEFTAWKEKKTFNGLGIKLAAGEKADIELKLHPTTVAIDGRSYPEIEFYLSAEGNDDNSNTVTANEVYANTLKVTSKGTATVSTDNGVSNSVFGKNDTDAAIAQWTVTVKNEELTLKKIVLTGTITDKLIKGLRISYDNGSVDGTFKAGTTGLVFDDISTQLKPGSYTFRAIANVGYIKDNSINLSGVSMDFEGVGEVTGAQTLSYTHKVIPVLPSISLVKADKESSKVMTFKITNTSDEETLTISGFTINGKTNSIQLWNKTPKTIQIKNTANNVQIFDGSSMKETVSIAPNKSIELVIMTADGDSFVKDESVRATLNAITFTTDDGEFTVESTMSNVAKWTDLDVSYTL